MLQQFWEKHQIQKQSFYCTFFSAFLIAVTIVFIWLRSDLLRFAFSFSPMNGIIYWENKKMVTIAVIGLGTFGNRVTEALLDTDTELVILDKDRDIVEKYKNAVTNAYITDAINEATLKKVIPPDVNAAIVDLGSQLETSILVTNHLKKLGVPQIIVKARSDEHGEILKLVGATKIIYPDYDAAVHIVPMLLSSALFNYMQLSENFAIAEVKVRKEIEGKTLAESSLRQKYSLNVIGLRQEGNDEIKTAADPSLVLTAQMILLVAGTPQSIFNYTERHAASEKQDKNSKVFRKFLPKN